MGKKLLLLESKMFFFTRFLCQYIYSNVYFLFYSDLSENSCAAYFFKTVSKSDKSRETL